MTAEQPEQRTLYYIPMISWMVFLCISVLLFLIGSHPINAMLTGFVVSVFLVFNLNLLEMGNPVHK